MKTLVALCCAAAAVAAADLEQVEVFRAGQDGYHTYRIPALIATKKGTLLAFCEGRHDSAGDAGDIDLLVKRSADNGRTWSAQRVVAEFDGDTVGNPAPVVDRRTGRIVLLITRNPGKATERHIIESGALGTRTVWVTYSSDDGDTWTAPKEITAAVKRPDWTWYATGPGNGIQLRSGRLVVPCDHNGRSVDDRHSHVIYSDDGGDTWRVGGVAGPNTNESAVAELRDGSLLLNMRSYHGQNRRAVARSRDGGLTWSEVTLDEALMEPVCQASMVAAVPPGQRPDGRLLFSNPAALNRARMTVRLSPDGGRTWPVAKVIHEGPAAYSSLCALPGGRAGLLYERGETGPYERITFARFYLSWLSR